MRSRCRRWWCGRRTPAPERIASARWSSGADGRPTAHAAHAALASSLGDLDLRLVGGMEAGRWRGELADARVAAPTAGTWRLARAAELSADAGRIRLEWSCLESDAGARLCADFERTDQIQSSIDVEGASAFGIAAVAAGGCRVDRRDRRRGGMVAQGWTPSRATWRRPFPPGELTLPQGRSQALSLPHADTKLDATIDERGAEIGLDSMIAGDGRVRGPPARAGPGRGGPPSTAGSRCRSPGSNRWRRSSPFPSRPKARRSWRLGSVAASPRPGRRAPCASRWLTRSSTISESSSRTPRVEARAEDGNRVTVAGELRSGGGHLSIEGSGLLEAEDLGTRGVRRHRRVLRAPAPPRSHRRRPHRISASGRWANRWRSAVGW